MEHIDVVVVERGVLGHDDQSFDPRPRDEHSVEGVPMMHRKRSQRMGVLHGHRELEERLLKEDAGEVVG